MIPEYGGGGEWCLRPICDADYWVREPEYAGLRPLERHLAFQENLGYDPPVSVMLSLLGITGLPDDRPSADCDEEACINGGNPVVSEILWKEYETDLQNLAGLLAVIVSSRLKNRRQWFIDHEASLSRRSTLRGPQSIPRTKGTRCTTPGTKSYLLRIEAP